jgi:hypothetical protein
MTERGTMTVREAGRRGGNAVLEKYGAQHFEAMARRATRPSAEVASRVGRAGGLAVWAGRDRDEREAFSRRGGEATLARHGVEHYRRARRARTEKERLSGAST